MMTKEMLLEDHYIDDYVDDHVDREIESCFSASSPNNFFVFAGAGSGKTRSLINTLNFLDKEQGEKLLMKGKQIAVITYTNAACDEISRRLQYKSIFSVSTIHSFLWELNNQVELLRKAEEAVELLMKLWNDGKVPTCLEVLKSIRDTGLFKVGNRVDEVLADYSQDENEKITALRTALSAPFYELERYALYVSDNTRFATHQGVKGLEFPRVMVILDDAQARGFLFSYEKLFGVKAQSDTDEKNAHDGKDTSITRTARLFYVACTRAKKSLAIVAYTENEEMVRDTALANGWFLENEIYIV